MAAVIPKSDLIWPEQSHPTIFFTQVIKEYNIPGQGAENSVISKK